MNFWSDTKHLTWALVIFGIMVNACRHDVTETLNRRKERTIPITGGNKVADGGKIEKAAAGEWTGLCTINQGFRLALKIDASGGCQLHSLVGDKQTQTAFCQQEDTKLTFRNGDSKGQLFMTCEKTAGPVKIQGKIFPEGYSCATSKDKSPPMMAMWGCEIMTFLPPEADLSTLPEATVDADLPSTGDKSSPVCMFNNPVLPTGSIDPWVTKASDSYFVVFTKDESVNLRKSTKLQEMAKDQPKIIWRAADDPSTPFKRDISGAKLYHFDQNWYLYMSGKKPDADSQGQRLFVLKSVGDDPNGPYNFADQLGADAPSYSPSVYVDGSARYLLWAQDSNNMRCIYIATMNGNTTLGGAGSRISCPDYEWEKVGSARNDSPEMLRRRGTNMLIVAYSAGSPENKDNSVGVIYNDRGNATYGWRKLDQPWFKKNGKVYGAGHLVFTTAPNGKDEWMMFHGMDNPDAGMAGQATRIQPYTWDDSNYPRFEQPVPSDRALPCPR